jgi:hypothetical protein
MREQTGEAVKVRRGLEGERFPPMARDATRRSCTIEHMPVGSSLCVMTVLSSLRLIAASLILAGCSDPGGTPPPPSWTCLIADDSCSCYQFRPGWGPNPASGVEVVDECPEAACCVKSNEPDESSTAQCSCSPDPDACAADLAAHPGHRSVGTCPP